VRPVVMIVLANSLGTNQNLHTTDDCDESGGGDNPKECSINSSNEIGAITQTNDAQIYLA
jgi:hypothetical protein